MSYSDTDSEMRRQHQYLEAENKQLREELQQVTSQLSQYKSVNESQQTALKEKDSLLEQLQQVNESLRNDIKVLKEIKPKPIATASGYPAAGLNPWADSGMPAGSEPEQYRKLFVGGLNYETDEDSLRTYFEQFGDVEKAAVILDANKQSRGFGFVIYKTAAMVDAAQAARPHVLDDRTVDSKRALPKEDTREEMNVRVKKLFVGGFTKDMEDHHLRDYFSQYGHVEHVEMLTYRDTGRKRGFAFVLFDDYDSVDKSVLIKHHVVNGSRCEVKKAISRDHMHTRKPGNQHSSNTGQWGNQSQGYDNNSDKGGSNYGNSSGNYGNNRGDWGNKQGNYSGNQNSYSGNQGGFGGNQGNFGGTQGGNQGGNQGNFGGNPGNFGGNQGNFGGNRNDGGNFGGGNQGNFGGNQGNFSGDAPAGPGGPGGPGSVPPEMAAMWTSFYTQYMNTIGNSGNNTGGGGGGGPIRNNNHNQRTPAPYVQGGFGQNSSGGSQSNPQAPS